MNINFNNIKNDSIESRKNNINNQDELILKLLQIIDPNVKKVTNTTMKDFLKEIGIYIPSKSKSEDFKNKLLKIIENTPEEGWNLEKLKEYVFENDEINEKKTGRKEDNRINEIMKLSSEWDGKTIIKSQQKVLKSFNIHLHSNPSQKELDIIWDKLFKDEPDGGWNENKLKEYVSQNEELYTKKSGRKEEIRFKIKLDDFKNQKLNIESISYIKNIIVDIEENYPIILKEVKDLGNDKKKQDVVLVLSREKKDIELPISYKEDSFRTIQSWTTNDKWESIFGKIFPNILNLLHKISLNRAEEKKENIEKLFIGVTIHLTPKKKNINEPKNINEELDLLINSNIKSEFINKIFFGNECEMLFHGKFDNIKNINDFFKYEKLYNKNNINNFFLENDVHVESRFVHLNSTTSNKSTQLLILWVPNENIYNIEIETTNDCLKYGKYMIYTEIPNWIKEKICGFLNTNNLIKLYKKERNITFPKEKLKKK